MIKKLEFRASIAPIMSGIRTGGDGIRLTLDIPESDVQDAVAIIALRNTPLRITVEVDDSPYATKKPKKEKASKPEKGPHGAFWQEMTKRGIFNHPDLPEAVRQVIGPFTGGLKDAFKLAYGVDSLTFISPEMFEVWSEARDLHQLVSISRQASAKVQEKV